MYLLIADLKRDAQEKNLLEVSPGRRNISVITILVKSNISAECGSDALEQPQYPAPKGTAGRQAPLASQCQLPREMAHAAPFRMQPNLEREVNTGNLDTNNSI